MITKLITTLFISLIAGRLIYAVPVNIIIGLILRQITKSVPGYIQGQKENKWLTVTSLIFSTLFFVFYGFNMAFIKFSIILLIFAYASISDIRNRSVPNYISVMIYIAACINVSFPNLILNSAVALSVFLLLFISAMISKGKIGGGDIKFVPACMLILGPVNGILALGLSFITAVVSTKIRNKLKNESDESFPLLPYISVCFMTIYLLTGGI